MQKLDTVVISSSSAAHKEQIELTVNAGLHVFCEKPLTTKSVDSEYIVGLVNSHQKQFFMPGYMRRYDSAYSQLKKLIIEGQIGRPVIIKSYSADPALQAKDFSSNVDNSGGIFMDLGIHDIDLARWYFQDEAVSVYSTGECYKFPEFGKSGDVDNAMAVIKFNGGQTFTLHAGRTCMHGYHTEIEIIGTEGSLRMGFIPEKNTLFSYTAGGVYKKCYTDYIERFEAAYYNEMKEFVDCILKREKPEIKAEDDLQAIKIAEACKDSLFSGKIIYI